MVQNDENINKVLGTMPDDIEKGGKITTIIANLHVNYSISL